MDIVEAKKQLDKVISKAKDKYYKPTQIAETLFYFRINKGGTYGGIEQLEIELDQIKKDSKRWRNNISSQLVGRNSNSTSRFEDNLFQDNAISTKGLLELINYNNEKNGVVEAYIYNEFKKKYDILNKAFDFCKKSSSQDFCVRGFIEKFILDKKISGSSGKVYEIVVYALFSSLAESLNIKVNLTIPVEKLELLSQISIFSEKIMRISTNYIDYSKDIKAKPTNNLDTDEFITSTHKGKVYRVGVTNAADRGIDMYANWGCLIQVKNTDLSITVAKKIIDEVTSDNVVIVCRSAKESVVKNIIQQEWSGRIQSIVTQQELEELYEKALRGSYSHFLGQKLLDRLVESILIEFPSVKGFPIEILDRNYPSLDMELDVFQNLV